MAFFSSKRERRLWLWTLAVVAAIYSTLSLARPIAEALRDLGLLNAFFISSMLLVGATVITQGLKTRPGGAEMVVALGVAAVYLLLFTRMTMLEERSHLIEYSVLALFIYEALLERASQGRHVPVPALLAILASSMIGTLDECIQFFLPNRVFDSEDIVFNILASVTAVSASAALNWTRRRFGKAHAD